MNANHTRIHMKFCKRQVVRRSATNDRCNTLLAEFLHKRQEKSESSSQNLEINYQIDQTDQLIITIPEDLLFKIFILLPAESLYILQFVCKKWFNLINCSNFIKLYHSHESETVLICQKLALSPLPFVEKPKSYFHFMDLEQGSHNFIESNLLDFVHILASCDGLVLAKMEKNKSLILTNPATRKQIELPIDTSVGFLNESYSLVFSNKAQTYKIVHLFYKSLRNIGCEIMSISTREWRTINGPASDLLRFRDIRQRPVSVDGSLYWLPRINGCDYLVSMNVDDEKFVTMKLPSVCSVNDRLVEIEGILGLVTHVTYQIIEVWILKKENWIKRHSIDLMNFDYGSPTAICSPRKGKEMVFSCLDHNLYVYNFDQREMKLVYSRDETTDEEWFGEGIENLYIPHRNTLALWEDRSIILKF